MNLSKKYKLHVFNILTKKKDDISKHLATFLNLEWDLGI